MKSKRKEAIVAYIFILPSLVGILIFYVVPYIICFYKSLFIGKKFVGLRNYLNLFENDTFLLALKNTVVFMALAIPILMIVSLLLAMFLNSFKKLSGIFKSALLIPVVVPVASLICVWQVLFDDFGAVNAFIVEIGLEPLSFFGSYYSMVMIIIIYVWKYCGFCVVLFSAGLAGVPSSLYESARLDGASKFNEIIKITLPMITPTSFFVFLLAIIYSFKIFREVFALFGNYPDENVYFLQNFINNNYYNLNYPRLSAASIVLSLIIVALLFVFYMFERKANYAE